MFNILSGTNLINNFWKYLASDSKNDICDSSIQISETVAGLNIEWNNLVALATNLLGWVYEKMIV